MLYWAPGDSTPVSELAADFDRYFDGTDARRIRTEIDQGERFHHAVLQRSDPVLHLSDLKFGRATVLSNNEADLQRAWEIAAARLLVLNTHIELSEVPPKNFEDAA